MAHSVTDPIVPCSDLPALGKRLRLILGGIGLLLGALALAFFLTLSVLDEPYARAVLSPILTLAHELKAEFEAHPAGGEEKRSAALVQQWQTRLSEQLALANLTLVADRQGSPGDVRVSLASARGLVDISTDPERIGKPVAAELLEAAVASRLPTCLDTDETPAETEPTGLVRLDGEYHIVLPCSVGAARITDILLITLPSTSLTLDAKRIVLAYHGIALTIVFVGMGFLGLGLSVGGRGKGHSGNVATKRAVGLIVCVVLISQLAVSGCLVLGLTRDYVVATKAKTELLLGNVARRIETSLVDFPQLEESAHTTRLLREVTQAIPEAEQISIATVAGRNVDLVRGNDEAEASVGFGWAKHLAPLIGMSERTQLSAPIRDREEIQGFVVVELSSVRVLKRLADTIFDGLAVILVSILVFGELLVLLRNYVDAPPRSDRETAKVDFALIRPAAFFYVFGIDLSMSFLPLHMERLYEPLFGLSKDVVTGLPISVEFFCVGIAILVAGAWYDRRGWHEPFLVGLTLASLGGLYSWLAQDALGFIVSRGVLGIGYGLALMASQGFVIGNTDGRSKARGLAHLFAGLYAGSICGGAMGGILAERFGYGVVFLLGAVTIALIIPYALTFMRPAMRRPVQVQRPVVAQRGSEGPRKLKRFLCDRRMLALMLFSSLPASVAVVGFLNYFSPLYLHRLGASESTIGQVLVIYGICLIFVGPVMGKYADRVEDKRIVIFVGCSLGGAAFLMFNVFHGVLAAAVAVLLLGLSHSLVLSSQSAYALELQVTRDLGEGKALGIFRSSSRLGQMIGPMVFSGLAVSSSVREDVAVLGTIYLALALLFLLLTLRDQPRLAEGYA